MSLSALIDPRTLQVQALCDKPLDQVIINISNFRNYQKSRTELMMS